MSGEPPRVRVPIREEVDVAMARTLARELAWQGGLSPAASHAFATAISEIARNIIVHAGAGDIVLGLLGESARRGVAAVAQDDGPGIRDTERALEDGYSTGGGLGLGLPSARRLVDEFELVSEVGTGTVVTMRMWAR